MSATAGCRRDGEPRTAYRPMPAAFPDSCDSTEHAIVAGICTKSSPTALCLKSCSFPPLSKLQLLLWRPDDRRLGFRKNNQDLKNDTCVADAQDTWVDSEAHVSGRSFRWRLPNPPLLHQEHTLVRPKRCGTRGSCPSDPRGQCLVWELATQRPLGGPWHAGK